jgi:hypothetical protein
VPTVQVILVHHLQREISDLKRELERASMLDAEVAKLRDELDEREKLIQQARHSASCAEATAAQHPSSPM